jgi:hypothetical protein
MGRHSMDYQPEKSDATTDVTEPETNATAEPADEAPATMPPVDVLSPMTPAPFPSTTFPSGAFNSIAPPGGPIDPGLPGAPDSPSYPEGPGIPDSPSYPPRQPDTVPAPAPSEPDITPSEPDPIPDDAAGTPAHYGRWFAAEEQAS